MPLESLVLQFIESYAPLVCLIGAYFGGDALIIFISSLSGQGLVSYWTIVLFCTLGTTSADVMWYFLGRTRLAGKLISSRQLAAGYSKIERIFSKYGGNDFLLLLIVKFVYGIRVVTIVYFSRERRRFGRFLAFDSFAVIVITLFVTTLGWLAGKGIGSYVSIYENFRDAVKIIVIVLVVFFVLKSLVNKWLLREKKTVSRSRP